MTRDKLLELYNSGLSKDEIYNLRDFSDIEINLIMFSKHKDIVRELLSNNNFRNLAPFTKLIVLNLVDSSKYPSYVKDIATNKYAISTGKIGELIESVNYAVTDRCASLAKHAAISKVTTRSKNVEKIVNIIRYPFKESLYTTQIDNLKLIEENMSDVIFDIVTNEDIILSGKELELVNIIIETVSNKRYKNIFSIRNIALNKDVVASGNLINYAKLIRKIDGYYGANLIERIATSRMAQSYSEGALEFAEKVSKLNLKQNQPWDVTYNFENTVIDNLPLLGVDTATYYIDQIHKDKNKSSIVQLALQQEIKERKEIDFWNLFKSDPDKATGLLETNVAHDKEVTPYVRLKRIDGSVSNNGNNN